MNPPVYPAWVDGRILEPGVAAISVEDLGFQLGFAVFDTLLQEDGCRYFEEDHIERLETGARAIGLAWPPPFDPSDALRELSDAIDGADSIMRLTYSRGVPGRAPTLVVSARELAPYPEDGVLVALESGAKLAGSSLEAVKATSRVRNVLARDRALEAGAFEALLCTDEGDVAEGTISNVFAVLDGTLVTPSLERGVLAGITRDQLLRDLRRDEVPCREGRLEMSDLERASELLLTNTTSRVIAVRGILGQERSFPGPRGEVFQSLRERFSRIEERYRSDKGE